MSNNVRTVQRTLALVRFVAFVAFGCSGDQHGGTSQDCPDTAPCPRAVDASSGDGGTSSGGNGGGTGATNTTGNGGRAALDAGVLDGAGALSGSNVAYCPVGATNVDPLDASVVPSIAIEVHHDQIGYDAAGPKFAVVEATGEVFGFEVIRQSDGAAVFASDLEPIPGFSEWGGGPYFYELDFTCLTDPGTYVIRVNGVSSEPFEIGRHLLFEDTIASVLSYFRSSRADDADVWAADTNVPFYGSLATHDVRGGWYDASGDISKYLSHLSYANFMNPQQIPLVTWALAWVHDQATDLLAERGLGGDVQNEALWGADYLLRVLDPGGFFYIDVFDGWTGVLSDRRICAFTGANGVMTSAYPAAFREGGGVAIAALARVARWGVSGSFTAAEYLEGARRAFAHLEANNASYTDDGRENIIDDYTALLAATELYDTTQDAAYLDSARVRASSLVKRLGATGYFIADADSRPFWHGSDAGLPIVALSRYIDVEPDTTRRASASTAVGRHLDYLLSVTDESPNPYGYARQHFNSGGSLRSGFFMPHDNETGYWWQGENARLASLSAAALIGGRTQTSPGAHLLGVSPPLAIFAMRQLDWVLGENPYDACFVNGFGRNNPPNYCGEKPQGGTFVGGIANGITGANDDGTGIQWQTTDAAQCWTTWRWIEQWLPHAAWYMIAVTAAATGEP